MKRIDFEAHYYAEEVYLETAKRSDFPIYDEENGVFKHYGHRGEEGYMTVGFFRHDLPSIGTEKRIKEMDEAGITMQVLSSSQAVEQIKDESALELARISNNHVHDAMIKYPGRFTGLACLPVSYSVEKSIEELERCVKELGFIGWNTFSTFNIGMHPDNEEFRPIFAKCAELGVCVYIHPGMPDIDRLFGLGRQIPTGGLGFGVDTQITACRIIMTGIFDEFPNLKMILGHYGEGLPFNLERMESQSGWELQVGDPAARNKENLVHYFRNNVWYTTSGNSSVDAFICTKNVVGADHILLGCDYPFEMPYKATPDILDGIDMTDEEREKIYFGNAEKYFGIKL